MAVDLIARALALKAAGGGSGGSGFAKEADFNAPGFMPEENTYYIYKDSGIEPVIEYKPFVIGEEFPSGSTLHINPEKQNELANFVDSISVFPTQGFFFAGAIPPSSNLSLALAVFVLPQSSQRVTVDAKMLLYTNGVDYIPIYSDVDVDLLIPTGNVHFAKGYQNLDENGNVIFNYDDTTGIAQISLLNYASDPTLFDNLDWNGKIISWAEPQTGSKYQDGVLYLYQDGAMHEIGPQGEGDDAPILNADFYAEDFTPQNGRFYRQVGTSKKIGPIEHEQGSRNLTLYFDMFMPFEDMVYALEGLERDEVPPMSETEGLKMWAMVGDKDGGSFSSISILHVPANAEGMACDKDFWQIGIFGGLFSLWNSETYQMQVEQGKPSQTVVKGWHESMSGQTFIVDGKMVMTGADYYVFNTQYWNAFTSTEPIKEAAKNTIAKYHDNAYDEVVLKSDIGDNIVRRYYSSGKQISADTFYKFLLWALSMFSTDNEAMASINRIRIYSSNGVTLGNTTLHDIDIYNPQFDTDHTYTVKGFTYNDSQVHEFLVKFGSNAITLTNLDDNTTSNIDYVSIISYYATSQYGEDF